MDKENKNTDFIFRYGNEELAKLEGSSLDKLLNKSFYSLFPGGDTKWREVYSETALNGTVQEFIFFSPEINKHIKVQCYQPFYGYCACMLSDVSKSLCLLDFKQNLELAAKLLKDEEYPKLKKLIKKMSNQY